MDRWITTLREGDPEAAWDLFVERYRRLIFATIRHYAQDYDDVMDVFAQVCGALRANKLARLRRYTDETNPRARFSTWLVAVVRNQTIDWFRHRDGRKRLSTAATALPPVQQSIFKDVFLESRSHLEAYELLRTRDGLDITFGAFLKDLHATYAAISSQRKGRLLRELGDAVPPPDVESHAPSPGFDTAQRIAEALEVLQADERVAVQLFVVEQVPATEVARMVGWPNAKAVYNRVYRVLARIRAGFERQGIGPDDL